MSYHYSDLNLENEPHALPNVWVTELTAREMAEQDEDMILYYMRRPEFKLASMNSRVRDEMIDALIEEEGITGGWCWCYCMPGCLPDSLFYGPFASHDEAVADMRANTEDS